MATPARHLKVSRPPKSPRVFARYRGVDGGVDAGRNTLEGKALASLFSYPGPCSEAEG